MSLTRDDLGVWMINLPRDEERRGKMEVQLAALGLDWQLFEAVNGRAREAELLARADPAAYARNMGSPLLPGKLGVYASHIGVWEAFLASGKEVALILEDDVVFHEDFLHALDLALKNDDLWDLVRFNCIRAKLLVSQAKIGPYSLNAYVGPFTGNACYLIHREVAARILPQLWPQTRAMDHELNRFFLHNYRQLGLQPWSSHPDDGGTSTITGTGFALVKKFKWYRRLPHYLLKAANYFRRFWWLLRKGMLTGAKPVRDAKPD